MPVTPDAIEAVLISADAIGLALILLIAAALRANRPFVRDVMRDPRAFWRTWATGTAILGAGSLLWIGLADNWMELVTVPYRMLMRYEYQRIVTNPVDPELRTVSLALLALTAVGVAALFARHIGGYAFQIGLLIAAVATWMPLFIFAQRLNLLVIDGFEASETWPATFGVSSFWVVRTGLMLATILASITIVTMIVAPVVTVVLDVFRLRRDAPTAEAATFYAALHDRASEVEDVPLAQRWKPIRRPV